MEFFPRYRDGRRVVHQVDGCLKPLLSRTLHAKKSPQSSLNLENKRMPKPILRISLFASVVLCLLPVHFSRPVTATATRASNTVYLFIEIESKVYRKDVPISNANPSERRWYFSNIVVQPMDVPTYSLIKQKIMPYFSRNVMDPFEARGFSLDYGEQDVRLNGETSYANYETREQAVEQRNKELEYRKGQSGNIYSFELVFGPAKGEETSKPKLIYRDKEQPNYGDAK
jgi:hypothetical protein